MPNTQVGLEARYRVEKINDPNGKHTQCRYFVLDPQHDPTALATLHLYAVRTPNSALARDLLEWIDAIMSEQP